MVRSVYRMSGGRANRVGKANILLLTTTGRRSGRPHTVPLVYVEDDGCYAVTASNAGQDHDPAWYRNLQANPDAVVEIGPRSMPVTARLANDAERAVLWPRFVEVFWGYATYARRTSRNIPVVLLEPR